MIVEIEPRSPVPPYEQLRQQVAGMITARTLEPGLRLPPIRQLAADLDLAPGTVARAYRELEADGLVIAQGRRGTRVAESTQWRSGLDADDTDQRLDQAARHYVTLARQLGVSPADALARVGDAFDVHPEEVSAAFPKS